MKPILRPTEQDTIFVDKITDYHLIVATTNAYNYPVMLTRDGHIDGKYKWVVVNSCFTSGNTIVGCHYSTIQECVEFAIQQDWKIAVYHENDYKKALQWLIDNH
jgi:hypothetical protein